MTECLTSLIDNLYTKFVIEINYPLYSSLIYGFQFQLIETCTSSRAWQMKSSNTRSQLCTFYKAFPIFIAQIGVSVCLNNQKIRLLIGVN